MKILLVSGKYLPGKKAGIENYTHLLATFLLQENHEVSVAILSAENMQPYLYEEVSVFPLTDGYNSFKDLLQKGQYDICHIQEYSGSNGIDIHWFTTAKQHTKKVFFTFHLPYLTCYKNDFRYKGVEDCNNFTSNKRCVECIIATKLNYKQTAPFNLKNSLTDLAMPALKKSPQAKLLFSNIQLRTDHLNKLMETCDEVFIYAGWFKKLLSENGYAMPVIKKIPYVITKDFVENKKDNKELKKRILFAGRIEEPKGLHLLCKAMQGINMQPPELDVFGNIVDEGYFKTCQQTYNFNYKKTLPLIELLAILRDYDFLIMPSVFTEMYSMMVKYSFHQQLPVIASDAKGNKDVIKDGVNGFLFDYDDYTSLADTLTKAYLLKAKGWQPIFEDENSKNKDVEELMAYYCW